MLPITQRALVQWTVAHHRTPSGLFLVALILVAILYVGWRSGRLKALWREAGARRPAGQTRGGRHRVLPEGVRLRPLALVPTLLLVAVVVVLLLTGR